MVDENQLSEQQSFDLILAEVKRLPGFDALPAETKSSMLAIGTVLYTMRDALKSRLSTLDSRIAKLEGKGQ